MKYTIAICLACLSYITSYSQAGTKEKINFELNADIRTAGTEKIYLLYVKDTLQYDSVMAVNGVFKLRGHLNGPTYVEMWTYRVKKANLDLQLFFEPKKMTLTNDSTGRVILTGSSTDDLAMGARKIDWEVSDSAAKVFKKVDALGEKDSVAAQRMGDSARQALLRWKVLRKSEFIRTHPNSIVSAMEIRALLFNAPASELKALYDVLDVPVKNTFTGRELNQKIYAMMNTDIGVTAKDFTLKDVNGNGVSLYSFRGKYVLIDFWASWCVPCRMENPNVVAAYHKFKDKGFEILSVSLDGDAQKWKDAIAKDHLNWTHVSELKGWSSTVAQQYAVAAVPSNFLLDPRGVIIAKNLRGEALEKKLEEIFSNL